MSRLRRAYYDKFSSYYDRFVALHSRDPQGLARTILAGCIPVQNGGSVLDLCTVTGTLLSRLLENVGASGLVVGLDSSRGMLNMAHAKTRGFPNIRLIEADAGHLPFKTETFDAVTCSHAFYELKGETRNRALEEVLRILRPNGTFLMMEHDVPSRPIVRALFYLRLTIIGAGRAITFLRHEQDMLEGYFSSVEKLKAPAGRSKIFICRK